MESLPTSTQTLKAGQWFDTREASGDRVKRALLSSIDGHRNVVQRESCAREGPRPGPARPPAHGGPDRFVR